MTRGQLVDVSYWKLGNNHTTDFYNCIAWYKMVEVIHHKVLHAAILLTFSPIAILLNLILIVSFVATRQVTQNTSNFLIFVTCFSDLTVGAIIMPFKATILLNTTGDDVCMKTNVLTLLSAFEHYSIALTVLIAVDRYLHMNPSIQSRPSKLRKLLKKPKIYYLTVLVFFIYISLLAFKAFFHFQVVKNLVNTLLLSLLSIHIIIITFLYARGYLRIRKFTDSNPVYCDNDGSSASTPDYVRRLYKTVLVLILLALFQYVPNCLTWITFASLLFVKRYDTLSKVAYFIEISSLLMQAGCITNSLAVLYFNKQARHWISKLLRRHRIADESS